MEYIPAADAAKKLNLTLRRLQQKCAKGEIPGAKKAGRRWFVPQIIARDQGGEKKPLPIGISDYKIVSSNRIHSPGFCPHSHFYSASPS